MSEPEVKTPKAPKDHRHGHRDRLRARFVKTGIDGLADYEVLELLLFSAIPRKDVKPLAKDLIARFKSFSGVMAASISDLEAVKGVSTNTAVLIKTVVASMQLMLKDSLMDRPVLSSWQALLDYLHLSMAHEQNEQFRVLFLNRRNELIADEVQQKGTVDHTPVYPREIVKRALEVGATAVILVHNHPSGDPEPSTSDIEMTREIVKAAAALDVVVHDHLIIARSGYTSFKSLGLL